MTSILYHSFKIAARSLRRHRLQSATSITGLAVGFACFSLATLWVRHEMSHDTFHDGARRFYTVSTPSIFAEHGTQRQNAYPLARYLAGKFPGVEGACSIVPSRSMIIADDARVAINVNHVDEDFLSLFGIKIIEGDASFTLPDSKKIAITAGKARQLFGDESPVGKRLTMNRAEFEISAVVSGWTRPSNYPFDALVAIDRDDRWNVMFCHTILKISPGVDGEEFTRQFHELEIHEDNRVTKDLRLMPLVATRYLDPLVSRQVKFHHILLFSLAGLLVILCSLFNYLVLSVGQLRARARELSLRVVCGSSAGHIYLLLSAELLLTMLLATAGGTLLLLAVMPSFCQLSGIEMSGGLHVESLLYILGAILLTLLLFIIALAFARRRSLLALAGRRRGNRTRAWLVGLQLVISTGFIFCPVVMLRQIHYLRSVDLGFRHEDTAVLIPWGFPAEEIARQMQQIPLVTSAFVSDMPLVPVLSQSSTSTRGDGDVVFDPPVNIFLHDISAQYAVHYGFQLLAGEMLADDDPGNVVLVNETLARLFGWDNPVGKQFDSYTVKGLIRDIRSQSPTMPVKPLLYRVSREEEGYVVHFSYLPGRWEECREAVVQLLGDRSPEEYILTSCSEAIAGYFKSEDALLKLLGVMAGVCLVLCTFGFISMITLDREERRREIAIRKVNGATTRDILLAHVRFHATVLLLSSLVAFPVARLVMQRWMEQYTRQAGIPVTIDLSILLFLALLALATTGWHVHRASIDNPTDALKVG
jgi:hypothetical protein